VATDRMALLEHVGKAAQSGDVDFLRQAVKTMAEALMELEVAAKLGAGTHERTPDRLGYRNGHRTRDWDTRAGTIPLEIPRVRRGSYFPDWLLEPRRRAERALFSVVAEAYVLGVSTRKVDALVPEPRHRRHQQERGVAHVHRARPRGEGLPRAAPR